MRIPNASAEDGAFSALTTPLPTRLAYSHQFGKHEFDVPSANRWKPRRHWVRRFFGVTIAAMKKGSAPKSRRRSRQTLDKKILVYFTQAERELVDKAAELERRSISSFVANAAIVAAERLVTKRNQ